MTDTDRESEGGMQIDAALVRQLAELLNENHLTEIEVEDGSRRIVVKRQSIAAAPGFVPSLAPQAAAPAANPITPPATETVAAADHPGTVKAPMVGTVYLSGSPGGAPFVSAGDAVKAGDTLLVVEAMKVMNAITAPKAGLVSRILVENGQPVEFGQPLLIVE